MCVGCQLIYEEVRQQVGVRGVEAELRHIHMRHHLNKPAWRLIMEAKKGVVKDYTKA